MRANWNSRPRWVNMVATCHLEQIRVACKRGTADHVVKAVQRSFGSMLSARDARPQETSARRVDSAGVDVLILAVCRRCPAPKSRIALPLAAARRLSIFPPRFARGVSARQPVSRPARPTRATAGIRPAGGTGAAAIAVGHVGAGIAAGQSAAGQPADSVRGSASIPAGPSCHRDHVPERGNQHRQLRGRRGVAVDRLRRGRPGENDRRRRSVGRRAATRRSASTASGSSFPCGGAATTTTTFTKSTPTAATSASLPRAR